MGKESIEILDEQLHQMELMLKITLQQMKIEELKARADTLLARAKHEEFKLEQLRKK